MSSVRAIVTLNELTFPDITGKTITAWGTVVFGSGTYFTGGIPFGLVAFADSRTVDHAGFLDCSVKSENPVSATTNLYTYVYSPANDLIQIIQRSGGGELAGGLLPAAVLNDNIIFHAEWDRTTARG